VTGPDVRKAVVLLESLPDAAIDSLQAYLTPVDWQALQAARRVIELAPDERSAVIADFVLALAERSDVRKNRLQILEQADAAHLAAVLEVEHAQLIALVLTRLTPAHAGGLLALLATDLQASVVRRIATTESAHEQVLDDVLAVIAERLRALPAAHFATIDGVAALGDILQSLDRAAEQQLINCLAQDEPDLAEAVACHTFAIADVLEWSQTSAQILLANLETAPLAVALKQVTSETRQKILGLLPAQFAERLRHAVAHLGPVPPKIIEQSRASIARTLGQLQTAGKLRRESLPTTNRLVA
jgi:flagellar motor switch protein FliG